MKPIAYKVRPSSSGGWTTYLDLAADLWEDELLTRLSAATGQPVDVCRTVGAELIRQIMAAAREGRACPNLFDLLRSEPTSGGAASAPDEFHGIEDIEFGLSLGLLPKPRRALGKGLHIERTGLQGTKTGEITSVEDFATSQFDRYTVGAMIVARGRAIKLDPQDPGTGLYFQPEAGGLEVRCSHYGPCTKGRIVALVPDGLTGPQRLVLRVRVGKDIRTSHYAVVIQPA